jgi:uncharacterized repeat protein (TIGR02543 family)
MRSGNPVVEENSVLRAGSVRTGNASLLGLALLMACAGGPAARAAGVVTNCNSGGSGSLAAAVSGGGLVTFAVSCINEQGEFTINSNTTIDATGRQVVLDGSTFNVQPQVKLALINLTIQDANNDGSGAILNEGGDVIIANSTFTHNGAIDDPGDGIIGQGGAILNSKGRVIITNSTFSGNFTSGGGGEGGAVYNSGGAVIIANSTFYGNTASSGGAIYNSSGTVTLENTILAGSGSGGNCAGIGVIDHGYNLADDSSCKFTATGSQNGVTNLTLGSLANNGGWTQTIAPGAGSPAIGAIPAGTNGCATTITTDQTGAARPGDTNGDCSIGAYESVSPVAATITDCTDDSQLQSSVSAGGRIVFGCSGTISTSGLSIASNTRLDATGQQVVLDGGGQYEVFAGSGVTLALNNLTIQNGTSGYGGAISNYFGTLIVANSTFFNNSAPGGVGGAIFNEVGALIVANSTFSSNSAPDYGVGGAIDNYGGTLTIANSAFSNNSAPGAFGGAIYSTGTLIIANSTFSHNSAPGDGARLGGAILNDGTATLENTILAGNSGGNCTYGVIDGGYNLDDDGSCGFSTANHSFSDNSNANLGTLSYNGGPALTIPLNRGSAGLGAIPFGSSGCGAISSTVNAMVLTDERGVVRPQFTSAGALACDIGAVQSTQNQVAVTFNTNPVNLAYSVGPASYTGPQTLTLPTDTQTTIWAPSPQPASAGTGYVWQGWSDAGAQAHQITILPPASGSLTYTANFNTFYLLTTGVNPGGAGTVSISASAEGSNGYYPPGTQITLMASPNSGYLFEDWNGLAVTDNPLQITLTAPTTETAYFSPYTNEGGSVSVTEVSGLLYSALLANPGSPGSPGGGTTYFLVTNTGGSAINGPIQLVLTNLPPSVTGANSSGTFNGSPYWTASMERLGPGGVVQVTVQLNYAASTAVSTTPVIYSGSL